MTTKDDRDLEAELGPSPWGIYADEEEPWKDLERLLKLDEKFDYQYEIAHVLGTTPATISYWMGKAHEHRREEALKAGALCKRCEDAETPGGGKTGNELCVECLSELRDRDCDADYDDYAEYLREINA